MNVSTILLITGAALVALLGWAGAVSSGPQIAARLESRVEQRLEALDDAQVQVRFTTNNGLYTRHPTLLGGERYDETRRGEIARIVAGTPGVGGIRWSDSLLASVASSQAAQNPLHCQEDVESLLSARTIRFEEGSAELDEASEALIDEVAEALRPCLGAIIALDGHTDRSGSESRNVSLSYQRAQAVRAALMQQGIPADGLRVRGLGSRQPVPGLAPADPANRRIEFRVLQQVPLEPTPIDTPAPR